jgi:hypothetical protein
MKIQIDHLVIGSKDKNSAASLLGTILGVQWERAGTILHEAKHAISSYDEYRAERASVYVNGSLTIDFVDPVESARRSHFCFHVDDASFDAIIENLKNSGISFRSEAIGPIDNEINFGFGGKRVYWDEPENQNWEMLTVSYARKRKDKIE